MLFGGSVVEAELTLFEEEMEVLARDAVVFSEHALGLIPEVFDAVDVMATPAHEGFAVIDAAVLEAGYVQNIVTAEAVRIDDGVR